MIWGPNVILRLQDKHPVEKPADLQFTPGIPIRHADYQCTMYSTLVLLEQRKTRKIQAFGDGSLYMNDWKTRVVFVMRTSGGKTVFAVSQHRPRSGRRAPVGAKHKPSDGKFPRLPPSNTTLWKTAGDRRRMSNLGRAVDL
jgi:hypothetical protein